MKLLLIRHAAAIPRGTPGVPDDERPLTPDGKAKFHIAARGLARATAEIAARAFANITPTIEPALARSSVDGIVAALKIHPPGARIALVGHEPLLGALLARLLGAGQGERLAFATGGAALVDLPDGPAADGRLRWFLKPRILRTLAGLAEITEPRADPPPVVDGRDI
jgi:phosphohistidine phosphatase